MTDFKKKARDKSGWFRYILIVEGLLLFSFIAAGAMVYLVKDKPAPSPARTGSQFKHLFRNYKLLSRFFQLDTSSQPPAKLDGTPDIKDSFIEDIINLDKADTLKDEKKMREMGTVLEQVKTSHPFILFRKKPLLLKHLYSRGNYREYIGQWDPKLENGGDIELPLLLMNCYSQTRNDNEAFEVFKRVFSRNRLAPFMQLLQRQRVNAYFRKLTFDEWEKKLDFLLNSNQYSEFNLEKTYIKYPQLVNLYEAEFAYDQKQYTRAQRFLTRVKDERLLPDKIKLLLKMDVRQDQFDADKIDTTLAQLQAHPSIYYELNYDLGAIFSGKGEPDLSLKYLVRYVRLTKYTIGICESYLSPATPLLIRNSNYWRAVWRCAWFYYQKNDKKNAAKYFREGTNSTLVANRIGSLYWLHRIDKRTGEALRRYPLSYYYTKTEPSRNSASAGLIPFIERLNRPAGKNTAGIVARLEQMVRYGMISQARSYIDWLLSNSPLNDADKYSLALVKSILYLREENFYFSFTGFRDHFDCYRCVRLPRFLASVAFPLKYNDLVSIYSDEFGLDPMLVFALIRQESFFRADIISPANAHGLMQLLLKTARSVALRTGRKIYRRDLYNPETNIKLGIEYLKFLMKRYDNKVHLALAAYNAGPHRVDAWLELFGNVPDDQFIEMIPFTETRNYVKKILRNHYYYKFYYGDSAPNQGPNHDI